MRKIISTSLVCTASFFFNMSYATPIIIEEKRNYHMPELPTLSFATITSNFIEIEAMKKFKRFQITIPKKNIINLAVTRNKNPVLSERITGKYLSRFMLVISNNTFSDTPVDAQIIINNQVQSIKIVGFNFTPTAIHLIVKPFIYNSTIKPTQGPGVVIVNSSCVTNRVICSLGCTYMIVPNKECRKKLGIL